MAERPRGRQRNVTGTSQGVKRRGSGLGTGPVGAGAQGGYSGRPQGGGFSSAGGDGNAPKRSGGMRMPILAILLLLVFGGGGGFLTNLMGGGSTQPSYQQQPQQQTQTYTQTQTPQSSSSPMGGLGSLASLLGGGGSFGGDTSAGWLDTSNLGKLNRNVDSAARAKYTKTLGNGQDTTTIMVFMCGTDLESRSAMASNDLNEMLKADIGNNINLIVYTGGTQRWQNNVISNATNQIYQIKGGRMIPLETNVGDKVMTDPATLTEFIRYCKQNFPANRNDLIFWDHGGGSITGYGHDEKHMRAGSMNLAEINTALKDAGMQFDFIGFDTCLMATLENALMLNSYADYMIASEETEPGLGWYYTDWLTEYGANPSMETIDIGKNIVDSFVAECQRRVAGQKTTLSVVDLAELSQTVPDDFKQFSAATSSLIQEEQYQTVSKARNSTREFARSSRIDQVDLIHLASNMGTEEGKALADTLAHAIKYNRTSSNMTNAYGLSIYFPYNKVGSVDEMADTYEAIGLDESYTNCIKDFAAVEATGQISGGGAQTASPLPSLFGLDMTGSGSGGSADLLTQMMGQFLMGSSGGGGSDALSLLGLSGSNMDFFTGRSLSTEDTAQYVADNHFDSSALTWEVSGGQYRLSLAEDQWEKVNHLVMGMFYDDGEGYVDLGLDNVYDWDEDGSLIAVTDRTWLAINSQPVAYYYMDTEDDGENYVITGYVPCFVNDVRAQLLITFDNERPKGYIAGVRYDYVNGETQTIAKALDGLSAGDAVDFVCDFYDYEMNYQDSYYLGEQWIVEDPEDVLISNVDVGDGEVHVTYRFTDIYNQQHWTEAITLP